MHSFNYLRKCSGQCNNTPYPNNATQSKSNHKQNKTTMNPLYNQLNSDTLSKRHYPCTSFQPQTGLVRRTSAGEGVVVQYTPAANADSSSYSLDSRLNPARNLHISHAV